MTDAIEKVEVLVGSPSRNDVTLRITTRDGIVGLGDATVNGRELSVAAYVHHADDYEPAYLPVARRRDGTLTDW